MTAALTDEALMIRLKRGDMEALGVLYRRHCAMVKRAVRRFAPEISSGELEDLVQDVFLKLRRSASYYEEQSKCPNWIFGIAVQTAQNWRRSGAIRGALLNTHESKPVGLSLVSDNSPEAAALNRDLIDKTIRSLNEEERRLLVMYEVDGFSAREIGDMMGLSEGAIWTRLHRLRRVILDRLKQMNEAPVQHERFRASFSKAAELTHQNDNSNSPRRSEGHPKSTTLDIDTNKSAKARAASDKGVL